MEKFFKFLFYLVYSACIAAGCYAIYKMFGVTGDYSIPSVTSTFFIILMGIFGLICTHNDCF